MSTLVEIESAAKQLPESDRQRLLISLMQSLRLTSQPLPVPRLFSIEEMQGWMKMKRTSKHFGATVETFSKAAASCLPHADGQAALRG